MPASLLQQIKIKIINQEGLQNYYKLSTTHQPVLHRVFPYDQKPIDAQIFLDAL